MKKRLSVLLRSDALPSPMPILRSLILGAACSVMLSGCVLAVVGAAAGAGGYTMGQERGPGGVISDGTIKTEINARWAKDDGKILSYVDLNVFEGRVLLTGDVPTPDLKEKAVSIARGVGGVSEVLDNINVGERSTLGSNAHDNWILTRLRSALTFDGDINSLNYSLQCVDGVVYILGVARTQEELDAVIYHARNIPNVVRVVSYIRIRPGAGPNGSGDQAPSGGGYTPAPVTNGAEDTGTSDTGASDTAPQAPPPSSSAIQSQPLQ